MATLLRALLGVLLVLATALQQLVARYSRSEQARQLESLSKIQLTMMRIK